jgi:hypothetical protein
MDLGRAAHRGRRASAAACLATLLALGVALSGCTRSGLDFRSDDRLQIENLKDRSTIELPHRLEFSFDGTLGDGGIAGFAVLVDWSPPPPGKSLASLLKDDPVCSGPAGCPVGYLDQNRISVTTDTTFELDNVPVGSDRQERRGYHELTIILVDAEGRRVGEASAYSRFRVPGVNR